MARRLNDEDPDDDKTLATAPVTRQRSTSGPRSIVASHYLVFGFLIFGVLVLVGSLAFTILASKRDIPDPVEEWSIVSRRDWGARPRTGIVLASAAAKYVIVGHTATRGCSGKSQCAAIVRDIQAQHLQRGLFDIACNFLVAGDGSVYEGRGWGVASSPSSVHSAPNLAISLIGNFTRQGPSADQVNATRWLIQMGVEYAYVIEDYILLVDLDPALTSVLVRSRENKLVEEISTWPHWSVGRYE